jgi:hypothetical protein
VLSGVGQTPEACIPYFIIHGQAFNVHFSHMLARNSPLLLGEGKDVGAALLAAAVACGDRLFAGTPAFL